MSERFFLAWLLVALLGASCAHPAGRPDYVVLPDEDDPAAGAPLDPASPPVPAPDPASASVSAPVTARASVTRAELNALLDAGPGELFRAVAVTAHVVDDRFAGWELVRVPAAAGLDLAPGDVVLAVNGCRCERPEQLSELWESLRFAHAIVIDYSRAGEPRTLRFSVVE